MSEVYSRSVMVVGTPFRAEEVEKFMDKPRPISLVLEPKNSYDECAIKVMAGTLHLGYVPAVLAGRIYEEGVQHRIFGHYVESFWKENPRKPNQANILFDIVLTDEPDSTKDAA